MLLICCNGNFLLEGTVPILVKIIYENVLVAKNLMNAKVGLLIKTLSKITKRFMVKMLFKYSHFELFKIIGVKSLSTLI